MKINSHTYIPFKKTLVGTTQLPKNGEYAPVKIYKLDKDKDISEFEDMRANPLWSNDYFLLSFKMDYKYKRKENKNLNFYSLENAADGTLCFCEIENFNTNKEVHYLEVAPKESRTNESRRYKFIGETMMSFLAHLCKKEKRNLLIGLVARYNKTPDFYYNVCSMTPTPECGAILPVAELSNLINQNKNHLQHEIDIVC